MRISRRLAAAALLGIGSQQAGAATQPSAGIYFAQGVHTAVTPTGGATDCPSVGDTFSFYFQYPGPSMAGATFYANDAPGGVLNVQMGTFPTTPAAGGRNWAGSVHVSDTAGNKFTIPFAGGLTFFTASAFRMNMTKWNEPSPTGGTCNEAIQLSFIRTGSL